MSSTHSATNIFFNPATTRHSALSVDFEWLLYCRFAQVQDGAHPSRCRYDPVILLPPVLGKSACQLGNLLLFSSPLSYSACICAGMEDSGHHGKSRHWLQQKTSCSPTHFAHGRQSTGGPAPQAFSAFSYGVVHLVLGLFCSWLL